MRLIDQSKQKHQRFNRLKLLLVTALFQMKDPMPCYGHFVFLLNPKNIIVMIDNQENSTHLRLPAHLTPGNDAHLVNGLVERCKRPFFVR